MAQPIILSIQEEALAKRIIKCIFEAASAGHVPQSDYSDQIYSSNSIYQKAANELATEIVARNCDFVKNDLDGQLQILSQNNDLRSPVSNRPVKRTPEQLAKYIAWFCSNNGIIWDDIVLSNIEQDAIKATILGKQLYDAGCFLSSSQKAATPSVKATTGNSSSSTTGYKSSGPHSQDIPNLIGGANQKVQISGPVYCVIADKTGKNTPNAYITPLKVSGNGTVIQQVSKQAAETVNFNSGNGYSDCMCWFDNYNEAANFCKLCIQKFSSKYNNIRVVQDKATSNGYFRVSTEFGNAYIKANKLNEQLSEELCEASEITTDSYVNASKNFKITDIDLYDEWSQKSYS